MIWSDLAPIIVSAGGIITALAAFLKIRNGEGNKRIDAQVRTKELDLQADHQDNVQIMELVHFQQAMLDKHQARLEDLQYIIEVKAEQEAENRAELRLMRYRIAECEEDRVKLRRRIARLERQWKDQTTPPEPSEDPEN